MRTKSLLVMVLIVVVLVVAALFLFSDTSGPPESGNSVVRMGLIGTPDVLDVPYFIAQQEGFFEEEGMEVEFVQLHGDAVAIQALISGDIDLAASGHFSVINAARENISVRAFVAVQRSHDYVLATPKTISQFTQLRDKKIGIFATGDITEIVTISILKEHGIDPDEVDWIAVGGSTDRYRALITGEVAAVPLHADFGYKIEQSEDYHVLVSIADEIPLPMSTVSASVDYINSKPEVISAVTRALIRATRAAVENKELYLNVAARNIEGINQTELSNVYDFLIKQRVYGVNGGINVESIQNGIAALKEAENIEQEISVEKVANFTFIDRALSDLGTHEY